MNERQLTALAEKAIAGDEGAFEKLYSEHVRSILLHVRSLIFDKENCYDVAQEAVYAMYKSIHRLKSPAAFRGWMHQVIRSTCYDHNGKVMRTGKHEDADDYDETIDALVDEDIQVDPEASTMAKLEGNQLFALVNELPEAYREVLAQRYYDDMTYKEISEALGISVSNVSTRLQRATEALRKKIGESGGAFAAPDRGKAMKEKQSHTQTGAGYSSERGRDGTAPHPDVTTSHLEATTSHLEATTCHPDATPCHPDSTTSHLEATPCHPERSEGSSAQEDTICASGFAADLEPGEERTPNDIEIEGAGSLKSSYLSGAAMLFPGKQVADFLSTTNAGLATMGTAAAGAAVTAGLTLGKKILIAAASLVLVIGAVTGVSIAVTGAGSNEAPISTPPEQVTSAIYNGTMHLEFTDANGIESDRNVVSILLVEDEPAAVSVEWSLYWVADTRTDDENGQAKLTADAEEITSGTGFEVESTTLANLEPGFYLVAFTLTDANNASMEISRNFLIAE